MTSPWRAERLPEVPWLSPEAFIQRALAMMSCRSLRSSFVMASFWAVPGSAGIERRLAGEIAAHLLGGLLGGKGHGAHRGAGDMRGEGDIGQFEQRPVR